MSMTRSRNHDASSRKRFKTWSELNDDMLFVVMMKLGAIDFVAFSGVCKSWRSLALSNKIKFMSSKPPMSMYFSNEKECHLEDLEGRKFKTIIPYSAGSRTRVGVSCGYLIFYASIDNDFYLVNPITRHELRFPGLPFYLSTEPTRVRAILVFSHSVPGWVFVVIHRLNCSICFFIMGKGNGTWNHVSSTFPILDIYAFKDKIYTLNTGWRLCEFRLNPEPKLTLTLQNKHVGQLHLLAVEFLSSGEHLYVIDHKYKASYTVWELDFGEMKWVLPQEKSIREYVLFLSVFNHGVVIKPDSWAFDPRSHCKRYDKCQRSFNAVMWYFPHYCFSVDHID